MLIAVAATVGGARLIDNLTVWPDGAPAELEPRNAETEAQP